MSTKGRLKGIVESMKDDDDDDKDMNKRMTIQLAGFP